MFGWLKGPVVATVGQEVHVDVHGQGEARRASRNKLRLTRVLLAIAGLEGRESTEVITAKLKVLSKEARLLTILTED